VDLKLEWALGLGVRKSKRGCHLLQAAEMSVSVQLKHTVLFLHLFILFLFNYYI
jgi:hypothetical protein